MDQALRLAVADCNTWLPNFLVHTGDFAGYLWEQVYRTFNIIQSAHRPAYACIGNHDEEEITGGLGNPNTAQLESVDGYNQSAPFTRAATMTSGDGTLSALCLFLDSNIYDDTTHPNHVAGDRVGIHTDDNPLGYKRRFGTGQISWVESQLAASQADIVLVFVHMVPYSGYFTDSNLLADALYADGRPAIVFCGHEHGGGDVLTLLQTTDTLHNFTIYKGVTMVTLAPQTLTGAWHRVTLSLSEGAISMDALEVKNFTNPGGWAHDAPFVEV